MSLFTISLLGLLASMIGIAFISAWFLILSINELDAAGAWIWTASFVVTSLLADFAFWGLL